MRNRLPSLRAPLAALRQSKPEQGEDVYLKVLQKADEIAWSVFEPSIFQAESASRKHRFSRGCMHETPCNPGQSKAKRDGNGRLTCSRAGESAAGRQGMSVSAEGEGARTVTAEKSHAGRWTTVKARCSINCRYAWGDLVTNARQRAVTAGEEMARRGRKIPTEQPCKAKPGRADMTPVGCRHRWRKRASRSSGSLNRYRDARPGCQRLKAR
jgi:hypothetical protein